MRSRSKWIVMALCAGQLAVVHPAAVQASDGWSGVRQNFRRPARGQTSPSVWQARTGQTQIANARYYRGLRPSEADEGVPYTSLILDGRGLGLTRSMSPRIFALGGRMIYGNFKASWEQALKYGVASYATSLDEARALPEAGSHPMVVRLAAVNPARPADAILHEVDAQAVMEATQQYDFLSRYRVIIVTEN